MKCIVCILLLASAVQALSLRRRQAACPQVCAASRCPPPPHSCYYGTALDICGCCAICAAGEGEPCGSSGSAACGDGLTCDSTQRNKREPGGHCICTATHPVCGSDGRTYPSVCRLTAENKRADLSGTLPVILVHKGPCRSDTQHQGSIRYKFNFIADVVDKIAPAVVHLELFRRLPFSNEEVLVSSGSGFIVSEDGWIVTNAHVLNNKQRTKVELKSGEQFDATVKDMDQKLDVALIKIESNTPLPVLHLGQSSDLRPGEFVVAVGSPFSLQNTVTTGIISTAQRNGTELGFRDSDMEYIQTDAIINYGNSGGPLVNLDGEVIGINTLKVTAGISFAIPVDRIRQFLAESHHRQIQGKTEPKKKFLGVRMLQLSQSLINHLKERESDFPDVTSGVYVYEVIPGAAAFSGGMVDHDVIIDINGQPVHTLQDVSEAVQTGAALTVAVRRKDGDVILTITPEEID
ncbi:serine protease HTRA1B [Lampris incognitus]|uniref:serine protease HTRA1B n=1 Tax=Lampris incognitus TaxID=2546036 RepID=UPI0024B58A54|nr:serine protease HTRA1B [Lampris incognitus]